MIIPGKIFKKHIEVKQPTISGWYLCYVRPEEKDMTDAFPIAQMEVIRFHKNKWLKASVVIGWMGPLPVLSLDELDNFTPFESGLVLYFIGTKEEAQNFNFKTGAFYRNIEAFLQGGKEDQYIYQMNSRTKSLLPLSKWVDDKWEKLESQKPIKKVDRSSIKQPTSTMYAVCTIKQITTKNYEPISDLISAMGKMPDKGYYLFEITRKSIHPIYRWKNGWAGLSKNLTRRVLNRIEQP